MAVKLRKTRSRGRKEHSLRNTKYLICIMLSVILALAGCGREPRSIDSPIIIPEETEAPTIEEGFEHITTGDESEDQEAHPVTPDPPETTGSGVTLLTPMNGGQSGNTSPAPAPIVGDTEYNENQTELMRAMAVQYAQKMGYPPPYCESYVESFRTAKWPTDADYSSKSADVPAWLYEGPVNRFSSMETKAEGSQYLNNVECLKLLGGKASQLVNIGKRHAEIYAFFDFVTDSKDTISSRLSMIYPAGHDVHQEAEDLYGSIMAKELTVEGNNSKADSITVTRLPEVAVATADAPEIDIPPLPTTTNGYKSVSWQDNGSSYNGNLTITTETFPSDLKSGYGFELKVRVNKGTTYVKPAYVYKPQKVYVYVPEWQYEKAVELKKVGDTATETIWEFPVNTVSQTEAKKWYVPEWWPDRSEYVVKVEVVGSYTPGDTLNASKVCTINIDSNMYTDDYTPGG